MHSYGSNRFRSCRAIRFNLRFGSNWLGCVPFHSVPSRFKSARFRSVPFVRLGSVRFGSARFGSVRSYSVRFDAYSVYFGSIWFGSSRFGHQYLRRPSSLRPLPPTPYASPVTDTQATVIRRAVAGGGYATNRLASTHPASRTASIAHAIAHSRQEAY